MEQKRHLGHDIKTVSNLIKRRIANSPILSEKDNATGLHGWIVGFIYHRGKDGNDVFQRDVEAEFSIRRSTATGILQLMEKNGLILREPVSYDARLKKLILTPKAIALHEAIVREIESIEAQLTKGLSEQEIETFYTIIEKMKRNME